MTPIRVVGITDGYDMVTIDDPDEARGFALKGFIVAKGWTSWFEKYRDVFETCLPMGTNLEDAIIFLGKEPESKSIPRDDPGVGENSMFRAV